MSIIMSMPWTSWMVLRSMSRSSIFPRTLRMRESFMSQMPSRSLVICVIAASLCDPANGERRVRVDGHRFGSGVGHGQRDVLAWAHLEICPGGEVLVRVRGADGLDHRGLGQRG